MVAASHQSNEELSETDVILLIKKENKDQSVEIEKIYLKKSTFDTLIAEWKPYINGIKWLFVSILVAFGAALITLVFNSIKP